MQSDGQKNNEELLTVIRRHTLEAIFHLKTVVVNYRKGQKQLKRIALHLKSTLARPSIYLERLSTSSATSLMFSRSPVYFYCLCSRIKSFWKSRQRLRKPIFWQFSARNPWQFSFAVKICIKTHCLTHCLIFFSIQMISISLGACWTR